RADLDVLVARFDFDRGDGQDGRNRLVADEMLNIEPQTRAGVIQHHDLRAADGQDVILVQLAGFAERAAVEADRGTGHGSGYPVRAPPLDRERDAGRGARHDDLGPWLSALA